MVIFGIQFFNGNFKAYLKDRGDPQKDISGFFLYVILSNP